MTQEVGNSEKLDTWAANGLIVEPDEAKKDIGWELQEQPPHEYANWLANTIGQAVNHILQNGVPEHNTTTSYLTGNIVQVDGVIYSAKADNTNSIPPNVNWQQLAPYPVKNSVEINSGALQLENDVELPGNNKSYGTDAVGNKGWKDEIINGFDTGDYKVSFGTAEKAGYVRCNGNSIGNASSSATERANADTEALFSLLWGDNSLVVSGGKGASADADFAANKNITLPDARNNVMAFIDGMGSSNTNRLTVAESGVDGKSLGAIGGEQEHVLSVVELAAHNHEILDSTSIGSNQDTQFYGERGTSPNGFSSWTQGAGDNEPHNNTQPTFIAGSLYIKL